MTPCSEFVLDDVMAITAIKLSSYSNTGTLLSPVIDGQYFNPTFDASTVVVGMAHAESGGSAVGSLVPIIRSSAKAKDTEADSVAGRSHTVSVECEVDDRDSGKWSILRDLERTPRHLILTLRDGTRTFVRATEDSYICTVDRGDGKTKLSFKVHNLMGMQLIS